MQQVLELKDCVTLKGGLKLDGVDESTASADLFKTVKIIEGTLEIKNAKATIDFRKLEKIKGEAGDNSMILSDCSHPILFPSLRELDGSVKMENCRIDAYKYLNEKYSGQIADLSRRVVTTTEETEIDSQQRTVEQRTTTSRADGSGDETTLQPVDHDETTKKPETDSAVSSTEPESSTEGQGATHPSHSNMAQVGKGNTSDSKGEDESISSNKTTLMIIAGLAAAVFLLTSVAIAVILIKCAVF